MLCHPRVGGDPFQAKNRYMGPRLRGDDNLRGDDRDG